MTSPRGRQFSDDVDDDDDDAYLRRLHKRTGFKSTDSFDDVTPDYVSGDFRGLLQRSAAPTRDMSSAAITNDVTAEQIDFRSETLTRRVKTKDCSSAHVQAEGEQLDFRSALTRQVDTDDKSSARVTSEGEQKDYRDVITRQVETKDRSSAHVVMEGEQLDFRHVLKPGPNDDVTTGPEFNENDDDATDDVTSHDVTQSSIDFENFGQEQTTSMRRVTSYDTEIKMTSLSQENASVSVSSGVVEAFEEYAESECGSIIDRAMKEDDVTPRTEEGNAPNLALELEFADHDVSSSLIGREHDVADTSSVTSSDGTLENEEEDDDLEQEAEMHAHDDMMTSQSGHQQVLARDPYSSPLTPIPLPYLPSILFCDMS